MTARKKRESFVAVDGTALAYRSHFAFINRPLTTRDGQVTSAVFGFILAFRRIMETLSPDAVVVVFDPPGPTFRHEMYKEYKAQRERMPDDLRAQFPLIDRWLDASGIPWLRIDGFEADDVLATLAIRAREADLDSCIVSNDKDLLQVVGPDLSVVQLGKSSEPPRRMDSPAVKTAFGVHPEQIVDFLALTGDASDNVPGVPGVGKKTAAKLLEEHGTLDALLDAAGDMKKSKLRENLIGSRADALRSRELVALRTDIEVPDPGSLRIEAGQSSVLDALYDELDFQSLRDRDAQSEPLDTSKYHIVTDVDEVETLVRKLRKAKRFALAVESDREGSGPMRGGILGVAFCGAKGDVSYLPIGHREGPQLPWALVAEFLRPLLEDGKTAKWSAEGKADTLRLARGGIELAGLDFDTTLASYVIDPSRSAHDVGELARERLQVTRRTRDEITGTGRARTTLAEAPFDEAAEWIGTAADLSFRLRKDLETDLDNLDRGGILERIEMPLLGVLAGMERTGVRIDVPFLQTLSKRMEREIAEVQAKAWKAAGEEFNLGSPKQVGEVLFGKLGLKPRGRTKTGHSTNADVLTQLSQEHEAPALILRHREIAKLKSTYVDALPLMVNPDTGHVHTTFQQAVAATGRLSSVDPNLQNVPIRTWEGREIRKAFVPSEEGRVMVSCDYSQIELRILAHVSGDDALIDAFTEGRDVHRATAALVFDVAEDDVTAEQRGAAKTINFAVIYGMGAVNLGRSLGISTREASRFIENYFDGIPGVRDYIDRTRDRARDELVVETLSGRRRPIPEIGSADHRTRSFGERIAVNTPIQGTAADILKTAMIAVDAAMRKGGMDARMVLTVHDELVFDCPEGECDDLIALVREHMSGAMELDVPLVVDAGSGANWSEAH